MWIEVYNERFTINSSEYIKKSNILTDTNIGMNEINNMVTYCDNVKLTRIEQNIGGDYVYTFANVNGYFYVDFKSYPILIPIINNYYYNNNSDTSLIQMDFNMLSNFYMKITILVNTDMIKNNLLNSAMHAICNIMMKKMYPSNCVSDLSCMFQDSSFLPDNILSNNIFEKTKDLKSNFKIKLFDYQKKSIMKMIDIENKKINSTNRTFDLEFGDCSIIWDPFNNTIVDKHTQLFIESNGGILADSMGLGKTVTMVGLMHYGNKPAPILLDNLYYSKATLVIVPSHLAKQWSEEYMKAIDTKNKKIICILTKTQHSKTTYKDFKEADLIIVTQQFLLNFKNYITICYKMVTPASYNTHARTAHLMGVIKTWKDTNADVDNMTSPLFEFFHFNRVIVDEGHEIFEKNLGNVALNKWLLSFLMELNCTYRWYVSGTPFTNGLFRIFDFIKMNIKLENQSNISEKLIIEDVAKSYGSSMKHNMKSSPYKGLNDFISSKYFMKKLLQNVVIRHRKEDVEDMVKIPGYTEMIEWVELTQSERAIYESRKTFSSKMTLQQLCCHPLIVESMKKMVDPSNIAVDLDQVKEMVIAFHKKQIIECTSKKEILDSTNQAYHMLLANYNSKISESTFMLNVLEKFTDNNHQPKDDEEITCVICFNDITQEENTIMTACGHLYCRDCILQAIKYKAECPTCKTKIANDMYNISKNKKPKVSESLQEKSTEINPLINKYGGKLGKLIQMVKTLLMQENRIIIFSQWDDMLTLVGKSLAENGITNSFIKGNVHCRNKAISQFKNKDNESDMSRVIMLSLKNSASGTNLTEATHIFFIEPINMTRDECKMIEAQAIGRACRLGQKKSVTVIRILCKNTIEEYIYKSVYSNASDTQLPAFVDNSIII